MVFHNEMLTVGNIISSFKKYEHDKYICHISLENIDELEGQAVLLIK